MQRPSARSAALATVPVAAALFTGAFDRELSSDLSVVTTESPETKKWLEPLQSKTAQPFLAKAPGELFFYLGLDAAALAKISDALKESGQPEAAAGADALLQQEATRNLKALMIGLAANETGAPFPDLMIAGNTEDPARAAKSLEEGLSGVLGSLGLPLTEWAEKKIDGHTVRFINSPMGLGLYLATSGDALYLASNEKLLEKSLKPESSLGKKLGQGVQQYVAKTSPAAFVHINFAQVADMMESLQGTLAAFSGGASQIEPAQVAELREMGALSVGIAFEAPLLKLHSVITAPELEKQ